MEAQGAWRPLACCAKKRRLERQRRKQLGMSGDGDLEAMWTASQKGFNLPKITTATTKSRPDDCSARSTTRNIQLRAYYRELNKVLDAADILLEILDVRDPMGCRSKAVEAKFPARRVKKSALLSF